MNLLSMKNVLAGTMEGKALGRYVDRIVNGGYAGPIGPLDKEMTVFMVEHKKFLLGELTMKEYSKAHKVYLSSL